VNPVKKPIAEPKSESGTGNRNRLIPTESLALGRTNSSCMAALGRKSRWSVSTKKLTPFKQSLSQTSLKLVTKKQEVINNV